MATYDYSKAGLGEVLDETGTFSEADRSAILDGLQSIGVFDAGSTAGELGRGETLFLGDPSQSDSEEFLLYDGDPTGPVEITGENKAVIFETTASVEANIKASGETVVATGQGDDVITSQGASKDYIVAGDGENTVKSGAGADTVISGTGNDTIEAGSGNDWVSSGDGDDQIDGGSGNDTLFGGSGDDTVIGGSGNDVIDTGTGDNAVDAGSGDDQVTGGDGNDAILGGSGNDTIIGGGGDDTVDGGSGADTITVSSGNDLVYGGAGNDIINSLSDGGSVGNDTIYGGSGNDTLYIDHLEGDIAEGGYVVNDNYTEITFENGDTLKIYDVENIVFKTTT